MTKPQLTIGQEFCLRRLSEEHHMAATTISGMAKDAKISRTLHHRQWAYTPLRELRLMGLVMLFPAPPHWKLKRYCLTDLGKKVVKELMVSS